MDPSVVILVLITQIPILAAVIALTVWSYRKGYFYGPLWEKPWVRWRQTSALRKACLPIVLALAVLFVITLARGPVLLKDLALLVAAVLVGVVNIIEPRQPNTRLNLRWMGVAFIFLGVAGLVTGSSDIANSTPLLVAGILIPVAGMGAMALSYIRAYPAPE